MDGLELAITAALLFAWARSCLMPILGFMRTADGLARRLEQLQDLTVIRFSQPTASSRVCSQALEQTNSPNLRPGFVPFGNRRAVPLVHNARQTTHEGASVGIG